MPKVSIIVPVYGVENYLERCVRSLLSQTLSDIEIVLVDDGSPDKSGYICDQFAKEDKRVKVVHKPNGGVSAARNDGFELSTGDYIIFCDSDDWMEKDACEILYEQAVATYADIVIGDVYMAYDSGENHCVHFYEHDFVSSDRDFIDKLIQADFYRNYCPIPPSEGPAFGYGGPWNKLVRRSLLIDNNIMFDIRLKGIFDDILYTAYILATASTVAYIQKPVYYYRQVMTSLTASFKKNTLEINDAIFTSWKEFISEYGKKGQFEKAFYANVVRRLTESLSVYFFSKKNTDILKHRIKELKTTIVSEPYLSAAKEVDMRILSKYHQIIASLLRAKSSVGIYIVFQGKEIIKKVLKK